jgi:hypothetical protein
MPDDRYPYWLTEQSSTYRGPTSGGLLRLAVLALLAVLGWGWLTADDGPATVDRRAGVSLCEEHAGRPGWAAVCSPPEPAPEPATARR